MQICTKENEEEIIVKFSPDEIEKILRNEIRKLGDEKMMSETQLRMMKCYKKDNIDIEYNLEKNNGLNVIITEG